MPAEPLARLEPLGDLLRDLVASNGDAVDAQSSLETAQFAGLHIGSRPRRRYASQPYGSLVGSELISTRTGAEGRSGHGLSARRVARSASSMIALTRAGG